MNNIDEQLGEAMQYTFGFYGNNINIAHSLYLIKDLYRKYKHIAALAFEGIIYYCGFGIQSDKELGIKLVNIAINKYNFGSPDTLLGGYSKYVLGRIYLEGIVLKQNYEKALELFTEAAADGVIFAYNCIALIYYRQNPLCSKDSQKKEIMYFSHAHDLGDAFATSNIAFIYGRMVGQESYNDDILAEIHAGPNSYSRNVDVNKLKLSTYELYKLSTEYYKNAADKGHSGGFNGYATYYQDNQNYHDIIDDITAEYYYRGLLCGNSCSYYNAAVAFYNASRDSQLLLDKFKIDHSQRLVFALSFFTKAAQMGDVASNFYLAHMYRNGEGTHINIDKAKYFIKTAVDMRDYYALDEVKLGMWNDFL